MRNVALVSLLAVAALLLFASPGARTGEVEAIGFSSTYTTSLSPAGPGIPGDITQINAIAAPDANFETLSVQFIDKAWTVLPLDPGSVGGIAGDLTAVSTLGILNGPCTTTTPVSFPLIASVTPATGGDGSPRGPADTTWTGFLDVAPADGLADGITTYPDFLDTNVSRALSGPPLVRIMGTAVVASQPIAVNVIQYAPNGLAAEFPSLPELDAPGFDLGYPSVVLLQNPTASDTPSNITDFCAPLVTDITIFGSVIDNPATAAVEGGVALVNPASGPYTMSLFQISDRDGAPGETGTGDGIEGDLDTCPYVDNIDGPGGIGDPRVPFPVGDPDFDGIDSACDNTSVFTVDLALEAVLGLPGFTSAVPWSATSPCRAVASDDFLALDCDADGFPNRQDACPQLHDPTNADDSEIAFHGGVIAPDGGASDDGIGNVCDLAPTVSDGHFHDVLLSSTVTVLSPDSDGDTVPDFVEVLLGSDPFNPLSTPENLIPIDPDGPGPAPTFGGILTCIDGLDNDLDGATDFLDDSCGLPHDIEIVGVSGNSKTKENQAKGYSVKVANNGPAGEVVPVAVAVLPLTGCPPVGIDVNLDGVVDVFDGNINVDVNNDTIIDTLAFTATGVLLPGGPNGSANFSVFYSDCPGLAPPGPPSQLIDTTIADFVVLADACHLGDNAIVAPLFGGAPCGGAAFSDGGIDLNFGNDGPVTRIINVTDYLLIDISP